ncbi:MAG: transposase, partial [Okeania sp. SIO2D1]|nr:transposase [Okeania sp. SIO2D1]
NWYIHLSTYVQEIPVVHTRKNGCIGIDFNAESISVTYVKWDGNIEYLKEIPYKWKNKTTGQSPCIHEKYCLSSCQISQIF